MDRKKVAWQCRRGIKEVELILLPYFHERYDDLSEQEQADFVQLLDENDADLFVWLTENGQASSQSLQASIDAVLRHNAGKQHID